MVLLKLRQPQLDILAAWRGERTAVHSLPGEKAEIYSFFQQLCQSLSCDLDIAKQQYGFELVIRQIEQDLVFLFNQKAVAGFAQHRSLFRHIKVSHSLTPDFMGAR